MSEDTAWEVTRTLADAEERAVARDECRLHGHTFTEQIVLGMLAPQLVRCITCGARWRIHPDDVDEPWGTP